MCLTKSIEKIIWELFLLVFEIVSGNGQFFGDLEVFSMLRNIMLRKFVLYYLHLNSFIPETLFYYHHVYLKFYVYVQLNLYLRANVHMKYVFKFEYAMVMHIY